MNKMYKISIEDFVIEMDPITLDCNYKMRDEALRNITKNRFRKHIQSKPLAILSMSKSSNTEEDYSQFFFANGKFENTFKVLTCIGQGSFGMVFKAEHVLEKVSYAVKMVLFNGIGGSEFVKILNEVRNMARLNHRNIVKYFTCWFEDASQSYVRNLTESMNEEVDFTIQSDASNDQTYRSSQSPAPQTAMFIQMEYCEGGSLAEWLIKKKDRLHRIEAFSLFEEILKGLTEIHKANIIHRDLKLVNKTWKHIA